MNLLCSALLGLGLISQLAEARVIYFVERDNKDLQRLDTEQRALLPSVPLRGYIGGVGVDLDVFPGGRGTTTPPFVIWGAIIDDKNIIIRKDLNTLHETVVTTKNVEAVLPKLSYDGAYYYASTAFDRECGDDKSVRCDGLWRMSTATGKQELVFDFSKPIAGEKRRFTTGYSVVAADHSSLLFVEGTTGHDDRGDLIFLLDFKGKNIKQLTLDRSYDIISDIQLIGTTGWASFKAEVMHGNKVSSPTSTYLFLVNLKTGHVQKAFEQPQTRGGGFDYAFTFDRKLGFIEGGMTLALRYAPEIWQVGGGKKGKTHMIGFTWLKAFTMTADTFFYAGYNTIAAYNLKSHSHDFTFQNKEIVDEIWAE